MDEVFFMSFINETLSRVSAIISGKDTSTPMLPMFKRWRDRRNTGSYGTGVDSLRSAYLNGVVNRGDIVEIEQEGGKFVKFEFYSPQILDDGTIGHIFIANNGKEYIERVISTWRKV